MWYHLQFAIHVQTHKINDVTIVLIWYIHIYSGLIFEQVFEKKIPTVKYAAHDMTFKKHHTSDLSQESKSNVMNYYAWQQRCTVISNPAQ